MRLGIRGRFCWPLPFSPLENDIYWPTVDFMGLAGEPLRIRVWRYLGGREKDVL